MWKTARSARGHYQVDRKRQPPRQHDPLRFLDAALYSAAMNLGNVARVVTVAAACFAAVGSATSNSNSQPQQPQTAQTNAPPPQEMEAARALGLWRSTFGAVKIDADNAHGGIQSGAVHGVWQYQRQGQDVVGYFFGTLRGNVLQFRWQEPANPPLTGEGYLVFEQTGRQYAGRWWSDRKDRIGDWNGWRQQAQQNQNPQYPQPGRNGQYGGQGYGYPTQDPRNPQQPMYPQAPQQYPQDPQQPQYPQQPQRYPQQPQQPTQPYGPQQPQQHDPQQPYQPQQPPAQPPPPRTYY